MALNSYKSTISLVTKSLQSYHWQEVQGSRNRQELGMRIQMYPDLGWKGLNLYKVPYIFIIRAPNKQMIRDQNFVYD